MRKRELSILYRSRGGNGLGISSFFVRKTSAPVTAGIVDPPIRVIHKEIRPGYDRAEQHGGLRLRAGVIARKRLAALAGVDSLAINAL